MLVLGSNTLVKFDMPPERSSSGLLIIPSEYRDPAYTGTVIAIGPYQFDVKVDDKILFSRYSGMPIPNRFFESEIHTYKQERSMYAVVSASEILAVFKPDEGGVDKIRRETVAIDASKLAEACGDTDGEVIYVNYSHRSQTLYVTFEQVLTHA